MPVTPSFISRTQLPTLQAPPQKPFSFVSVLKFEEAQHPRNPEGTATGGRFRSVGALAGGSGDVGGGNTPPVEGDRARFEQLKVKWAKLNNELLPLIDHPESAKARKKMEGMKEVVKQMYRLNADPGGVEGVGLPGGPRDIVIVGAGPGGLATAVSGGTDGLDVLLIDAQIQVGGQAKASSRVENYLGFPAGKSGTSLAHSWHEQALRVGADEKLGVRVVGLTCDPKTELKTLTLSNGEVVTSRAVVLAGGVEFQTQNFPGSQAKDLIYGDPHELLNKGKDKTVVIVGGSNGAAQAALSVARTAKQVIVMSRSPIANKMSDYQVQAVSHHDKIQVVEGDEIASTLASERELCINVLLPSRNR